MLARSKSWAAMLDTDRTFHLMFSFTTTSAISGVNHDYESEVRKSLTWLTTVYCRRQAKKLQRSRVTTLLPPCTVLCCCLRSAGLFYLSLAGVCSVLLQWVMSWLHRFSSNALRLPSITSHQPPLQKLGRGMFSIQRRVDVTPVTSREAASVATLTQHHSSQNMTKTS